ncbi:putative ABC-type phosphate transporter [Helianthus annuus]|uniref:ABC-type phosphate transporter n=1 Tax=Helianthus annuus TaxID=4232 RepID=A0A9K3HVY9_HELAN|nr:putative ABC-type phosphate transporter [Helianthus annuus]KAJ0513084.1 putative ABC-type phosphate transporter [Helianthus annuus]KAJ0529192.1 putative ABC-type phosphate transporter [Helianthus annuus]KAJ0696074.1 putative ABC-type phosphate transporter [Helianthus annuus]KAJ0878635.1 putative ABC-type phosphate transporter [Helianthus annuus]
MAATAITSKSTARSSNLSNTHFNSIHFRKPLFVFRNNIKQKWGNLSLQGGGLRNREAVVERETIKRFGLVRCTAEGIERGQDSNFVMPERLKVVALMACVMCLCNADRVIMSVAVVPLAAKHGWNSSFLGIVQVVFSIQPFDYY